MAVEKLTQAIVDRRAADPKRDTFLWDEKLTGFGLKITKTGKKLYIIQYRNARGKSKRLVITTAQLMTLELAREEARRKLQMNRDGFDPAAVRQERKTEPTINEIIDEWDAEFAQENLAPKPCWVNVKCEVKQLRAWLGKLLVSEVNREMLSKWHKAPEQKRRPAMANAVVERLGNIWRWAKLEGRLPKNAPIWDDLFERFPWYASKKRTRSFTKDEYPRFYQAIQTHRKNGLGNQKHVTLFELLLFMGGRLREPMYLRYDRADETSNYIDEKLNAIVLQRHKTWRKQFESTGDGNKYVPITPEIGVILDRCKEFRLKGNPHVFPGDRRPDKKGPIKDPYDVFSALCKTAGIEGVTPHTLRHSLISLAINEGAATEEVMSKVIGHADVAQTKDYHHMDLETQRRHMEKVTALLSVKVNTNIGAST